MISYGYDYKHHSFPSHWWYIWSVVCASVTLLVRTDDLVRKTIAAINDCRKALAIKSNIVKVSRGSLKVSRYCEIFLSWICLSFNLYSARHLSRRVPIASSALSDLSPGCLSRKRIACRRIKASTVPRMKLHLKRTWSQASNSKA